MSKNVKYQILFIVLTLTLSLLFSMLLMPKYVMNMSKSYNKLSIYENTETDFVVMGPSKEQVDSYKQNSNITKIVPYYEYLLNSSLSNDMVSLIVLDNFEDINYTTFSNKRLIEQSNKKYDNSILIDYKLSQLLDLNLDDSFTLNFHNLSVKFNVSAIYETDIYYSKGLAVTTLTDDVKKMISQNNTVYLKYSAAYLCAIDNDKCWNELETYKPLAQKKDRSDFNNDLDYENYLQVFNSTDFRKKMKNYVADYNLAKTDEEGIVEKQILSISLILLLDLVLVMAILFAINNFKLKEYISKDLKLGIKKRHYIIQNIIFATVCSLLNFGAYVLFTYLFIDGSMFVKGKLFGYAIACFGVFAVLMFVSYFLINSILLKDKTKNNNTK